MARSRRASELADRVGQHIGQIVDRTTDRLRRISIRGSRLSSHNHQSEFDDISPLSDARNQHTSYSARRQAPQAEQKTKQEAEQKAEQEAKQESEREILDKGKQKAREEWQAYFADLDPYIKIP